jgi:hypothetical protein
MSTGQGVSDVSKHLTALIFSAKQSSWKNSFRASVITSRYGVRSKKTWTFSSTVVRTSNLVKVCISWILVGAASPTQLILTFTLLQFCKRSRDWFWGPAIWGALSPQIKRPWRQANHSPPCISEVRNEWSYTFTWQACRNSGSPSVRISGYIRNTALLTHLQRSIWGRWLCRPLYEGEFPRDALGRMAELTLMTLHCLYWYSVQDAGSSRVIHEYTHPAKVMSVHAMKAYGEQKYRCTDSKPRQQKEKSYRLHAPAALTPVF